jgi:alkanesulfonate monooxygenase SsuD/methylene tetrahydromethanopterin reductase-like flavin-dependent oxidoreductase (luciferase family)
VRPLAVGGKSRGNHVHALRIALRVPNPQPRSIAVPDPDAPIKLGANCWNQYTDYQSWLAAEQRADRLGFDSLWTWDHLYPIVGTHEGPILEPYTAMSAVAATTSRGTVGLMVGANTFRNPALTAKMVTTIDHISGGRAVLGIGAAWFELEHTAYGIPYGDGPAERLRWLGQALPIMRGMIDGTEPSAGDGIYAARQVRNDPPPIQRRLPILIGGGGKQVTLKLVARHGDACNIAGSVANLRESEEALLRHCENLGRDEREIERTVGLGVTIIRDSREEAQRVATEVFARHGGARSWDEQPVGTPEDVYQFAAARVEHGYRHLILGFPSPFDEETMTRVTQEVRPRLEAMIA